MNVYFIIYVYEFFRLRHYNNNMNVLLIIRYILYYTFGIDSRSKRQDLAEFRYKAQL